jgi:hypothetical protein
MAEEFEEITHCQMCDAEFRVGWSPLYEQKLIKHCDEHHITLPARNQSGLLPVE